LHRRLAVAPRAVLEIMTPRDPQASIRIAHVLGYAADGAQAAGITGVERVVESLLEGLGPEFEQTVVYPAAGLLHSRLRALAAGVHAAAPQRHFDREFLHTLIGLVRSQRLDVVVSHGLRFDFHAALACRTTGRAHVVSRAIALADETFAWWRRPAVQMVDAWVLRRARAIIAVSQASKERMCRTQSLEAERIEVVANGVAIPLVDPKARSVARDVLAAGRDAFIIGGVGQLIERKAFHLAIEAAASLRQERGTSLPEPVVALVGEGPERSRLQALARSRGVPLVLAGYQEDPAPFMAAFDVAVLPSRAEGMPMVLLEAMALGVPCVATPAAGNVEVIEDGRSGFLVRFDDAGDLADILGRLAADPALRARVGAAAATRIAARFSIDVMFERYRAVLRRAAGRG
jgi:glycosyltransferase involved in cell wall biosynthesis